MRYYKAERVSSVSVDFTQCINLSLFNSRAMAQRMSLKRKKVTADAGRMHESNKTTEEPCA